MRLYVAAVLRHVPEEPLQPVSMGTVHLANDADVAIALRMDAYLAPGANTGIPVGLYRSGATASPVYLDADFLLGPEAAQLVLDVTGGARTAGVPIQQYADNGTLAQHWNLLPVEGGEFFVIQSARV